MNELLNNRILCVDDDPGALYLYRKILAGEQSIFEADIPDRRRRREGAPGQEADGSSCETASQDTYEVTLARTGEEAVELVGQAQKNGNQFAVGFFDMLLPGGIDGRETICRILEIDPHIHCAIVTAHPNWNLDELNNIFSAKDQWLFINKPFGVLEIKQFVRNLMSAWHLKKTNVQYTEKLEEEVEKRALKHQQMAKRLMLISEFSRELSIASDLGQLLNQILEQVRLLINAKIGSILLLDNEEHLIVEAAAGLDRDKVLGLKNKLTNNRISGQTLENRQPILIRDLRSDPRFTASSEQMRIACTSLISVPLLVKGKPIGVINFGSLGGDASFSQEECNLVSTLAGQIAMSIENARLYQTIKDSYDQLSHSYLLTVKALTKAIDAKDHYTYGHSNRVARFSHTLAKEMGYDQEKLERLNLACILHDVGKIGIAESILNKPGRLTDEEFAAIKTHPAKGAEIIKDIPYLDDIREIVIHHHERFDGKGYPGQAGGRDIPLGSRIISVADTYDAMTSDRPYRQGLNRQTVFDEIKRCSGAQFDPDVVDTFILACKKGAF